MDSTEDDMLMTGHTVTLLYINIWFNSTL